MPPTKGVLDLLRELKLSRQHLAVVLDEYGSVDGVISMEDILEEIVGNIEDESEKSRPGLERIEQNTFLVRGSMNVMDINRETGIKLPETLLYETIGGFVMNQLGRIPQAGDVVRLGNVVVKVKKMEGNRVEKVLLSQETAEH